MHQGTTIDELIATVLRAEQHADAGVEGNAAASHGYAEAAGRYQPEPMSSSEAA